MRTVISEPGSGNEDRVRWGQRHRHLELDGAGPSCLLEPGRDRDPMPQDELREVAMEKGPSSLQPRGLLFCLSQPSHNT